MSLADKMRARVAAKAPAPDVPKMALSAKLLENVETPLRPNSRVAKALAASGVSRTREFDRILSLPRRIPDLATTPDLTPKYLREIPLCRCGRFRSLWPIQSLALKEAEAHGGCFAMMGVGHGKCLGKGTQVLLYDGRIVSVEEVKVGDFLMGPDSRPRKVLSTCEGEGPLYLVRPVKGEPWVCNDVHMLTLVDSTTGTVRDVAVDEFLNESRKSQNESKLFAVGVDFPEAEPLPLDPYFLGVWFGDGNKGQLNGRLCSVAISKPDSEIRQLVENIAARFGLKVRETKTSAKRTCPTFFLSRTSRTERNALLDLLNSIVGPQLKVPHQYLTASRRDRAEFLAGFLDTDGYLNYSGYEIVQKRKDYAESICFLARSLGLRAVLAERQVPNYGTYWRVSIIGDCQFLPLRIPRKKAPPRLQKKNPLRTGFRLERLPVGEFYGFTLDGDGRFLLGDFTVTHNTLTSLLAGEAMGAERIVLLVPAEVRNQLLTRDIPHLDKHFKLPLDRLIVIAYSELSLARSADVLERIKPDLIVADECHKLRRRESARRKRLDRYAKDHPECRYVFLSGTMTKDSIRDYAAFCELSLRKNSPLPKNYRELCEWSEAIDILKPSDPRKPRNPGALYLLCHEDEPVRSGFRRRLVETPGVVATEEGALGTSLYVSAESLEVPASIVDAISELETTWAIGEGEDREELEDVLAMSRVRRQLSAGFYYKWRWPNGKVDREWLLARREWHKTVRDFLKHRARPGCDSPLLLANAIRRGEFPELRPFWDAWAAVKDRPEPPVEPVWIDDFLIDYGEAWLKSQLEDTSERTEGAILWFEHKAVEDAFRARRIKVFGAGEDAGSVSAETHPVIACSILSQATGKNLQAWCKNLVLTPPPSGLTWEQMIGRTHRPGQLADEVTFAVCQHTKEYQDAVARAVAQARYIEETQGQKQKLTSYATLVGFPEW